MFTRKDNMSLLLAIFVFLIINMPSVKLIYSSAAINVIALFGLWLIGAIRLYLNDYHRIQISHYNFYFLLNFVLLWLLILWVTWLINPVSFGVRNVIQYFSVILFTVGIILFVRKEDLKYIFHLQLLWGSLISYLEITGNLNKDLSLGQNYLTTGVAIAMTIVMIVGYLFSKESSNKYKLLLIIVLIFLFNGLTSLSGRAPILLAVIVPVIILFMSMLFQKNKLKKNVFLVFFPLIAIIIVYVVFQNLPESTVDRILRMFVSIQQEPRYELYTESIKIISENPLGIGLTGQLQYDINYPHNLFLEIMMAGGIIAIIPLLSLLLILLRNMIKTFKVMDNSIIWMSMLLYIFLTWNISFDLSSSYMFFSSMSLYAVSSDKLNYNFIEINTSKTSKIANYDY